MENSVKREYQIREKIIETVGISTWNAIPDKDKDVFIKNMTDTLQKEITKFETVVKEIEEKRESYWLLFLGIILGISGNLVANIIDRNVPHGYLYNIFIILFFTTFVVMIFRYFKLEIQNKFNSNEGLKYLLEVAKQKEKQAMHEKVK